LSQPKLVVTGKAVQQDAALIGLQGRRHVVRVMHTPFAVWQWRQMSTGIRTKAQQRETATASPASHSG
jgi:hypothetical protein